MATPQMPNIPGAAVMTDTLDFVKNLWGSMSVPGMNIPGIATPTLSVDELDKKINDLKAVESWLNLNMSMLRGSIQALEVQRGTIVTLKSMSASFAAAVKQAPGAGDKTAEAAPYASIFAQPAAAPEAPAQAEAAAAPEAAGAAQMGSPTVWWNMLQDQFKQAVTSAMASDAVAGAAAMASDTAAKFVAAAKKPEAAVPAKPRAPAKKAAAKPAAAKPKTPRGQA